MKHITDARKLFAGMVLAASNFWIPVAVLYHQSRGATLEQVLSLLAFHYMCIVFLEYPTGVIGDRMGYRKSIALGYAIMSLAFFLLAIPGPIQYYYACVFLTAVGRTFASGSDIAFFHHLTPNFDVDYPRVRFISTVWTVVTMTLGGALGHINTQYTYIVTGVSFVFAVLCILSIRRQGEVDHSDAETANVFAHAKEGLFTAVKNTPLFVLLVTSMLILGFFTSIKWFYNPLFELASIDVFYWGIIISAFSIMKAVGMRFFVKVPLLLQFIAVFVAFIPFVYAQNPFFLLSGFAVLNILYGSLETGLSIHINDRADNTHRAATHSLQSLAIRLFSSLYLFVAGFAVDMVSLQMVLFATAAFLLVTTASAFLLHKPSTIQQLIRELL